MHIFLKTEPTIQVTEAVVQRCSVKKVFLEISQNSQACNLIKKETLAQVFSCEFCEISKNTFSYRISLVAASGVKYEKHFIHVISQLGWPCNINPEIFSSELKSQCVSWLCLMNYVYWLCVVFVDCSSYLKKRSERISKFTEEDLRWSLFSVKLLVTLKKDTSQVFSLSFAKFFRATSLYRASGNKCRKCPIMHRILCQFHSQDFL